MSVLTWRDRHALTEVLSGCLHDGRRASALAAAAGLELPPQRGFEPLFARLSGLVLAADRGARMPALLDALGALGVDEADLQAFRPPAPLLLVPEAPEGAAPRPAGVSVQAPSPEGASAWFARKLAWEVSGEEVRIRFLHAAGDAVGGAPAGHTSYVGSPFPVELELSATGAELPEPRQTIKADIDSEAEAVFPLVLGESESVDLQLRCYSAGFEVGRGRYRLSADGEESGGALAVPDTVLEPVNEDAIKTVRV